jgi:hypothetical protein
MGYIMKGSPAKLGTIEGTSGHASALKQKTYVKPEVVGKGKYHYKKAKNKKPGDKYYVHKYLKEGSVNVPHSGEGGGQGKLKWGYPKWVKE